MKLKTLIVYIAILLIFISSRLLSQSLVVTSLLDSGPGTLREAIVNAKDGAIIRFDSLLKGNIIRFSGIMITHSISIDGSLLGSVTIAGPGYLRLFSVDTSATVVFRNLVLVGGGGAIFNRGKLVIEKCTFSDNKGTGAAVNNVGVMYASSCTFVGNWNTDGSTTVYSSPAVVGGAICNNGIASLVNCTFSGNKLVGADSYGPGPRFDHFITPSYGGAIYNTGSLRLVYCTITKNVVAAGYPPSSEGAGLFNNGGYVSIVNSLIAGNIKAFWTTSEVDVSGTVSEATNSLFGSLAIVDSNIAAPEHHNLYGTPSQPLDPLLDSLAEYGGITAVHALRVGSPAIDKAFTIDSVSTDQRGLKRGLLSDIGSFERNPVFSAVPQTPSLVSPIADSIVSPYTCTYSWTQALGGTSYHLQVSFDSLFASLAEDFRELPNRTFQFQGLPKGSRLYWRVAGVNGLGEGLPSSFGVFSTGHVPDSVIILTPDSSTYHTEYITFSWNKAKWATAYHLMLLRQNDAKNGWKFLIYNLQYADTVFKLGFALNDYSYTFSITGVNSQATGSTTSRTFMMKDLPPPAAPVPLFPHNKAAVDTFVTLRWSDNRRETYTNDFFKIQVSWDTLWNQLMFIDYNVIDTTYSISGLLPGTYYWRVQAYLDGWQGDYSAPMQFNVIGKITTPVLIPPSNDNVPLKLPLTLSWNALEKISSYHIQVANTSSFISTLIDTVLAGTTTSYTIDRIVYQQQYFWRVQATNLLGNMSQWSTVSSFSLTPLVPTVVTLSQNYPNPFNPGTTIRYCVPKPSYVSLKLFNVLGKEIRTLVNEIVEEGWHDIPFDGSGLASGIYFYRIQTTESSQTKKLVLLR